MSANSKKTEGPTEPRLAVAGTQLVVDLASIEAISALREAGLDCILLKGPSLAQWLYPVPTSRSYSDCDLLVAASDIGSAGNVLGKLGYAPEGIEELKGDRPLLSHPWTRADGVAVDLHHGLPGAEAPVERVWEVLSKATDNMELRGEQVTVLNEPARTAHVVLHAAQHGGGGPVVDLAQALERLSRSKWQAALEVARSIDAVGAFAQGLSLLAKGKTLLAQLDLRADESVDAVLRAEGADPAALNVQWLFSRPTFSEKVSLALRKLFPPPGFLRARSSLAKRGTVGLILAYVLRPFEVLLRAVPGVIKWYRARRKVKGS